MVWPLGVPILDNSYAFALLPFGFFFMIGFDTITANVGGSIQYHNPCQKTRVAFADLLGRCNFPRLLSGFGCFRLFVGN